MKYLHINDCAGVSALIPEKDVTIKRYKDRYGFYNYYHFKIVNIRVRYWLLYLFLYILRKRPKEIWFHSALTEFRVLSKFKWLFRAKFVYWSHGSDLRNQLIPKYLDKADQLIKSTQSITDPRFELRQVPIDHNLFYPEKKIDASGVHIAYPDSKSVLIEKYCQKHRIDLTIIPNGSIKYQNWAKLLRKSVYYFESKGLYPERSKVFYEAQACGCTIIEENEL